ncbi:MAG: hypothetical protein GQ582_13785 [Methyloprofundus sp.]|nr:hypothetical protein [Methyloprofundus sp.]
MHLPASAVLCDVAIVGAGPAGCTTARLLSLWGFNVIVIDSEKKKTYKFHEVLPPSSLPLLDALELQSLFKSDPRVATPCSGVTSNWYQNETYYDDYFASPGGSAWVVERIFFDQQLKNIATYNGVTFLNDSFIQDIVFVDGVWELNTNNKSIQAPFVIDASGRASVLSRNLGAKKLIGASMVAGGVSIPRSSDIEMRSGRLSIKTSSSGWGYSLMNGLGELNLVAVSTSKRLTKKDYFNETLLSLFPEYEDTLLSRLKHDQSSLKRVDASSSILDSVVGDAWLAIGDAATAFDPITSQGLVNALSSAMMGAHACREFLAGNPLGLLAYNKAIQATWQRSEKGRAYLYGMQTEQLP